MNQIKRSGLDVFQGADLSGRNNYIYLKSDGISKEKCEAIKGIFGK